MDPQMPLTLGEAMATEPLWLTSWVAVLGTVSAAAILFVLGRDDGRWRVRPEPNAILVSFVAAAVFMGWLYDQVGYVRLLGLAHVVCWGPAYAWILSRRRAIGTVSWFGRYVHLYLVIAGISLVIDTIDVVRHLAGDGQLLHRWG